MLTEGDEGLAGTRNLTLKGSPHRVGGPVLEIAVNRQRGRTRGRQGEIGRHVRIPHHDLTRGAEEYALPNACIPIRQERDIELPLGIVITEVLPIDPVQPAIRQFDAVYIQDFPFWSYFNGKNIFSTSINMLRDHKFKADIHANHLRVVGDQVAIQPNVRAVVDAVENQRVNFRRRSIKSRPVPPVLLPDVRWNAFGEVHPEVEVLVNGSVF